MMGKKFARFKNCRSFNMGESKFFNLCAKNIVKNFAKIKKIQKFILIFFVLKSTLSKPCFEMFCKIKKKLHSFASGKIFQINLML